MKIVFITPTTTLRRIPFYRWGGKIYGQSNSITGPLILGGILKKADMFHKNSHARVIMGGMHPTGLPEEAAEHKETERRSSMEIQLEKEAHMPA